MNTITNKNPLVEDASDFELKDKEGEYGQTFRLQREKGLFEILGNLVWPLSRQSMPELEKLVKDTDRL